MKYFLWWIALGAIGTVLMYNHSAVNRKDGNTFTLMVNNMIEKSGHQHLTNFYYFITICIFILIMGQRFLWNEFKKILKFPFKKTIKYLKIKKVKREYELRHPKTLPHEASCFAKEAWRRTGAIRKIRVINNLKEIEKGNIIDEE